MSINVTQLRSFWRVARAKSFSGAARELRISQPTLTRQIRALENDYGVLLFTRSTRRIELTQEGFQLFELCAPIFSGLNDVEKFLKLQNARSVRIFSVQHATLSDFILMAKSVFPRVRFDVEIMRSTLVLEALLNRECDFGLLTIRDAPPEIDYFHVTSGTIIALVADGHPWRSRASISIRELAGQRVVLASRSGQSRRLLDENLQRYGVEVSVVQTVDSNEVVWDLVRKGAGIGVIGYTGLIDTLIGHHLAFEEDTFSIDVHFACRRERLRTSMYRAMFEMARVRLPVSQVGDSISN